MTEAPPAPAAAPSKPASVTPAVTTLKPSEPKPINPVLAEPSIFDEHFKSYDKPKEVAPAKPAAKPPEQPVDKAKEAKPEASKQEPVKSDVKPVDKPAAPAEEFKTNKDLRNAYDTTKAKAAQLEKRIQEFEAKLAQAEKSGTATDEKVWQERIAAKEKELTSIQTKLAETDFTQSSDYQTKFYKPYENAWKRAMAAVTTMQAVDDAGAAMAVTPQQAEMILSLPDAQAMKLAKQMFGDDITALTMLATHKNRIAETMEAMQQGKADFQKLSEERRNREFTERQQQGELLGRLWKQGNEAIAAKSPWFRPDETDPEGTEMLTKGFERADRGFTDGIQMTPEERVSLHVEMRNRFAAHERLVAAHDKLAAQVEALTKERDELMQSAPKGDGSTPKADAGEDKTLMEQLGEIKWKR